MPVSLCPCQQHTQTPHRPTLLFHDWERALGSPESETGSRTNTPREDMGSASHGWGSGQIMLPGQQASSTFLLLFLLQRKLNPKIKAKSGRRSRRQKGTRASSRHQHGSWGTVAGAPSQLLPRCSGHITPVFPSSKEKKGKKKKRHNFLCPPIPLFF